MNWNYTIINDEYFQNCLESCPIEYEPNKISNRCIESCSEDKHYMFNNECFYENCPNGTKLKEEGGHICICLNYSFYDKNLKRDNNFDPLSPISYYKTTINEGMVDITVKEEKSKQLKSFKKGKVKFIMTGTTDKNLYVFSNKQQSLIHLVHSYPSYDW